MEDFIYKIFNSVKVELLNGIDENYYQNIEEGFLNSLKSIYSKIDLSKKDYNAFLKSEIEDNLNYLKSCSPNLKLSLYVYDENFEKLNSLSLKAFHLALDKGNNDTTYSNDEALVDIRKMKEYLDNVLEFNSLSAFKIYDEGVQDYDYACGNTLSMSFRLSHNLTSVNKKI